jgi:hypothetical protein
MSNFIQDFMTYHSGTECHKSYLRWSAMAALGACAGPRYRLLNGSYYIYPIMYIILVGPQGNRKSYAMDAAKNLIDQAFPDYPIAADITSRDDIVRLLSLDITERSYVDQNNDPQIYHPLAFYISEFKDFTSYNPAMMINFLVNVYDKVGKLFKCSTIKRGVEDSQSPFVSILACENTDWFLRRLKEGVVTGGFSRRFIVCYEYGKPDEARPQIILPPDHVEIKSRMVRHLQKLHTVAKNFAWHPKGFAAFTTWYIKNFNEREDDSSIAGFKSTKDQQLLKVCMLLNLAEENPTYLITEELIEEGLVWLALVEPNLKKLYLSGGRNELQAEWVKVIDVINSRGGIMAEKEFLRHAGKDLSPQELYHSVKHLCDSDQLVKQAFPYPPGGPVKTWLLTGEGMKQPAIAKAMREFMSQKLAS